MKSVKYYKVAKGLEISVIRTEGGNEIGFHDLEGYLGKITLKK